MLFEIGDKIVYPMHGAGVIKQIEEREVFGKIHKYYIIEMPIGDMCLMIPVDKTEEIGIRTVVCEREAREVIESVPDIETDMTANWNKRYRDNLLRMRSGEIREVFYVAKGLLLRERTKGLSTGERKMLALAKNILISELVLATGRDKEEIEAEIEEKAENK